MLITRRFDSISFSAARTRAHVSINAPQDRIRQVAVVPAQVRRRRIANAQDHQLLRRDDVGHLVRVAVKQVEVRGQVRLRVQGAVQFRAIRVRSAAQSCIGLSQVQPHAGPGILRCHPARLGNETLRQQLAALPATIEQRQQRQAQEGLGRQQQAAAGMRGAAGAVDPDLAAAGAYRCEYLLADPLRIAPAGGALDQRRDQFRGGIGVVVALARCVGEWILGDDDLGMIRVQVGAVEDALRGGIGSLGQEARSHVQQVPHLHRLAARDPGPRRLPLGDEVRDCLIERGHVPLGHRAAHRHHGHGLGQRAADDQRVCIRAVEPGRKLDPSLAPDDQGLTVAGRCVAFRRRKCLGADGPLCCRRHGQWLMARDAGYCFQRVIGQAPGLRPGGGIGVEQGVEALQVQAVRLRWPAGVAGHRRRQHHHQQHRSAHQGRDHFSFSTLEDRPPGLCFNAAGGSSRPSFLAFSAK